MKLLLDMNLSPAWVPELVSAGWEATHWSAVGEIMAWAKAGGFAVTNDLDFSAILASTQAEGPSVVQVRAQDLAPDALGPTLLAAPVLEAGAILTLDLRTARVRTLPLS